MMKATSLSIAVATAGMSFSASAQTEIEFWHAFTGRLGELVAAQVADV